MIKLLRRISYLTNVATEWAAGLFAIFFTAILIVSVFSRYVFNVSIVASVEMTRIAFCWSVFLAAAAVVARGGHIRVVIAISALPPLGRAIVHHFVCLLTVAFGLAMSWYGFSLAMRMNSTFLPALQISQTWLYAPLPISGLLIVLHGLVKFFEPAPRIDMIEEAPS